MERVSYAEAREWFWVRTVIWTVVAVVVSTMAHFVYLADVIEAFSARSWVSVGAGAGSVLLGLLGAAVSLQTPWMIGGRRYGYVLNGPVCAVISGIAAALLCGAILSVMTSDPLHPKPESLLQAAYATMQFSIGASAFWGFVLGSWFVMRRDKYFVEFI